MLLGGLSPTALTHDYGVLVDEDGIEFSATDRPAKEQFKDDEGRIDHLAFKEAMAAWDERLKNAHYRVDLSRRILVFLEAPHYETFMRLRPILSHDAAEISFKFVDRPGGGAMRTMHVKLCGWPATIFCTTDTKYIEELATRSITHTPDMSIDKYNKAVQLIGEKATFPWVYKKPDRATIALRDQMSTIFANTMSKCKSVAILYGRDLSKLYNAKLPRDMRDYGRLQHLIEASTVLNGAQRPIIRVGLAPAYLAIFQDLSAAVSIFAAVEEATRSGVSGHVVSIFNDVISRRWAGGGRTAMGIQDLMNDYITMGLGEPDRKTWYSWINTLSDIGWIDLITDPGDKRKKQVIVTKHLSENSLILSLDKFKAVFGPEMLKERIRELAEIVSQSEVPLEREVFIAPSVTRDVVPLTLRGKLLPEADYLIDTILGRLFFADLNPALLKKEVQIQTGISQETNRDNFTPRGSYGVKAKEQMINLAKTLFDLQVHRDGTDQGRLELYNTLKERNPFLWSIEYPEYVKILEQCIAAGTVRTGSRQGTVSVAIDGIVPEKERGKV